jgi:acyl-CoA dehydrogenase
MTTHTQDDELSAIVAQQAERLFQGLVTRELQARADRGEWQADLWTQVAEAGLPLALVPDVDGGIGLPARDAFALVRQSAASGAPLPLGETILARALWSAAKLDAEDARLVRGAMDVGDASDDSGASGANGSRGAGGSGGARTRSDDDPLKAAGEAPLALVPFDGGTPFRVQRHGSGYLLTGDAPHVPWAGVAAACLLHARDDEGRGHLVLLANDAAAWGGASRNLAHEPHGALHLEDLPVPAARVRVAPGWLGRDGLQAHGALLRAQQMVGAMERCLAFALQYANERVQFGRPISKFPAVQNLLVEAACQTAAAGAAVAQAVNGWSAGVDGDEGAAFAFRAGVAKARAGEAAGIVAAACHQVHGAMGFTQEHPLHHFTRRLWAWRDEFGSESHWQETIGRGICERGGAQMWPWLTALQDGTGAPA